MSNFNPSIAAMAKIVQRATGGEEISDAPKNQSHISLGQPVRILLVGVVLLILGVVIYYQLKWPFEDENNVKYNVKLICSGAVFLAVWSLLVSGVRIATQWEKGILLRLGKFAGIRGPGLVYVVPFIDNIRFVDMRLLTLNIPKQQVITKDNVPATVDGVLFFLVADPEKAVMGLQDYRFAVAQYSQATLRDVVGAMTLDEVLTERDQIQAKIAVVVEERIRAWGLHLDSIRLQDIEMPDDLKRIMSRQASAEREKRANITKSEGDKIAATNLAEAARIMATTNGAMKLRTLQTIDALGASQSNTVIMFPTEIIDVAEKIIDSVQVKTKS